MMKSYTHFNWLQLLKTEAQYICNVIFIISNDEVLHTFKLFTAVKD